MVYEINRQVLPTAPSPTTTHLIVCIFPLSLGNLYVQKKRVNVISGNVYVYVYRVLLHEVIIESNINFVSFGFAMSGLVQSYSIPSVFVTFHYIPSRPIMSPNVLLYTLLGKRKYMLNVPNVTSKIFVSVKRIERNIMQK